MVDVFDRYLKNLGEGILIDPDTEIYNQIISNSARAMRAGMKRPEDIKKINIHGPQEECADVPGKPAENKY